MGRATVFGVFFAEFHFDHHIKGLAELVEPARDLRGIDSLDYVENFGRLARLVGLQVPDQVKAGFGQMPDGGVFGLEFLDIVFAELAQPGLIGFDEGFGREDLGDGDERDLFAAPSCPPAGPRHTLLNLTEIFPDAHALLIVVTSLVATLESFVAGCGEPVLIEAGQEPIRLVPGQYSWSEAAGRVLIEAWDDGSGRIARKVRQIVRQRPGQLELEIERFGKKTGTLLLVDRARAAGTDPARKAARMVLRERFRRFLARQYAGWTIEGLSTEADLENSLSPAFPRAMLCRNASAWAAIAAPDDTAAADHALTFGLIWLDYLRRREQRRYLVEGLCLFLPAGKEKTVCFRVGWLNHHAARFVVFSYAGDWEEPVDAAQQHGNLDTRVEPAASLEGGIRRFLPADQPEAMLESIVRTNPSLFDAALLPEPVYGQVPALAGGERGIIDLLSCTRSSAGRLAVLELKASADIHLPLQALDYWLRVRWHHERGDFGKQGYFPGVALDPAPPRMILIAPALQFHPTTETVVRYFDPRVEVTRIGLAIEWQKDLRVMLRLDGARAPT